MNTPIHAAQHVFGLILSPAGSRTQKSPLQRAGRQKCVINNYMTH